MIRYISRFSLHHRFWNLLTIIIVIEHRVYSERDEIDANPKMITKL